MKTARFALWSIGLLLAVGCAPPIQAIRYHQAENFGPRELSAKKVAVIVSPHGFVRGFPNAFRKVYGENQAFADELRNQLIQKQTALSGPFETVEVELSDKQFEVFLQAYGRNRLDWSEVPESYHRSLATLLEDLDYIILVSSWEISESWRQDHHQHMNATGQWTSTSSSVKQCHVNIEGGIIDGAGHTLGFGEANGHADVFMFTFKSTLRAGIDQAATHLVQFLNGQMNSENISTR